MSLVFSKLTYYFSKQSKKTQQKKRKKNKKTLLHLVPFFFFTFSYSQLFCLLFSLSLFQLSNFLSLFNSLNSQLNSHSLPLANSLSFLSHTPALVSSPSTVNSSVNLGTPPTNSHFSSSIQWGVPFVSLLITSMLSGHL